MANMTRKERMNLVSAWRARFPTTEEIAPRGVPHEGQYCSTFKSLQVELGNRSRTIMARLWDDSRVDFGVDRSNYNNAELERLSRMLDRRGVVPVTIGYVSEGRMGNLRQMHYVAVPTLGTGKQSAHYVFI